MIFKGSAFSLLKQINTRILAAGGKRLALLCAVVLLNQALPGAATAQTLNTLQSVDVAGLPDNRVQLTVTLSDSAPEPLSFTIDNPARIALDFPATRNGLDQRSQTIGVGVAKSLTAIEAKGRTRLVLNLVKMVPYETRVVGKQVIITLMGEPGSAPMAASMPTATPAPAGSAPAASNGPGIANVDFRRGIAGEGRVIVTLSNPSIPVDMRQEAGKIVLDFFNSSLPEKLERRLDVVDFATPVQTIDTRSQGDMVRMTLTMHSEYEHLAYQSENQFTVEVKPTTKEAQEERKKKEVGYTGERLSLNFQDIEVRSVLQLIADFTSINIVVSDTVTGNLTLRLKNVPWDQALDIVLKTKGLAMRQNGNVMLIGPSEEIAAREKLELESQKQIEELVPLYSEYVQINYAKAGDIADLLKNTDNSMLTEGRGNVSIDERTNTLLIQDTASKLQEIRELVALLDIPVRQVLIESRIVIANNDFSRDLGVRFGATAVGDNNGNGVAGVSGSLGGTSTIVDSAITNLQNTGSPFPVTLPTQDDRLMVDLPVSTPAGQLAVALLGSDYLLDLELSAMQAEGRGEIVSSPRVITSNQKQAVIKSGVEIPYQEATSSGATNVSFKEAVLSLEVTPQITPDDRVILDLSVNKDSVGQVFLGVPSINTRQVSTQVLVDNGETVVLGGVYEQTRSEEADKVPLLGDLPGLGVLFRQTRKVDDKSELLIFVTPKIIKESLGIQ